MGHAVRGSSPGFGSIWTTGENGVVRIDPQHARVVGSGPYGSLRRHPVARGRRGLRLVVDAALAHADRSRPRPRARRSRAAPRLLVGGRRRRRGAVGGRLRLGHPAQARRARWAPTRRDPRRRHARRGGRRDVRRGLGREHRPVGRRSARRVLTDWGRSRHARRPAYRPDRRSHPGRSRPWRPRGRRWSRLGDQLSRPATRASR